MNDILSGLSEYTQPHFWFAVIEIIWINVLLSGDNAIVIALACRSLPPKQRLSGMIIGTAVALLMRLIFASVVAQLMLMPYLKIVGGVLLLWIAVKLLAQDEQQATHTSAGDGLWQAIKIIALADIVMSLDNVIAVAAAAHGNYALLVFGLGISIPAIVAGATFLMAMLNYFPLVVWFGAGLLGWIAGDVIATDPAISENSETLLPVSQERFRFFSSVLGAGAAILGGHYMRVRSRQMA